MSFKRLLVPTLNVAPRTARLIDEVKGATIPRIIHQTFGSKALTPELWRSVSALKERNPGWTHVLYDDADIVDFLAGAYPEVVSQYYGRINEAYGAARADFFRYLLMYKVGGVYLDIKSSARKPLDAVVRGDDKFLISQWGDEESAHVAWGANHDLTEVRGGEFQQWFLVCVPGHPFLKAVIEGMLRNIDVYLPGLHGTGHYGLIRTTGPIAYTKAIAPILHLHPHRFARAHAELGFEYTIFDNEGEHRELSRRHYTELTEPIFHVPAHRRLVGMVYGGLRSAWGNLKRAARRPAAAAAP